MWRTSQGSPLAIAVSISRSKHVAVPISLSFSPLLSIVFILDCNVRLAHNPGWGAKDALVAVVIKVDSGVDVGLTGDFAVSTPSTAAQSVAFRAGFA